MNLGCDSKLGRKLRWDAGVSSSASCGEQSVANAHDLLWVRVSRITKFALDCAIHSLALTDHGLFEVGHYTAVNLVGRSPYWQWFLHRRLATTAQVAVCRDNSKLSAHEMMGLMFEAMTGKSVSPPDW